MSEDDTPTYLLIAESARASGCPIPLLESFEWTVENWKIELTGKKPPGGKAPFTAYLSYNGFPAGVVSPAGGVIAGSSHCNETLLRRDLMLQSLSG